MLVPLEQRKPALIVGDERNEHPAERQTEATDILSVCGITPLLSAETRTHRRVGYKNSVSRFHMMTMSKCNAISNALLDGTYKPQKGERHEVFEPKYRITVSTKYADRVPQSSFVTNYFYPKVTPNLIQSNCACMKGRGVDYARSIFKEILRNANENDCCLKTDWHGFFASICHEDLKNELSPFFFDEWARWYFSLTVDNSSCPVGIDLGSEVFQLSATSFPHRMDRLIDDGSYVRYQDDSVYVGTLERCKEVLQIIRSESDRLHLQLSERKTFIQPISRPIHFLGFSYLRKPTGRVTVKRLPDKIRHERRKLRRMEKLGVPDDRMNAHWTAVRACLIKGSRSDLHKMDKFYERVKTHDSDL